MACYYTWCAPGEWCLDGAWRFCWHLGAASPPGGSGWIISVGYYADNSFAALGSSDPREARLEL